MRKSNICKYENKDADQLCYNQNVLNVSLLCDLCYCLTSPCLITCFVNAPNVFGNLNKKLNLL